MASRTTTTASPITTANLGFPRIGRDRELKWALERHWRGDLDAAALLEVARELRAQHWRLQADRGIDHVPSGDFCLYDHVLDTAVTVGAVPARFGSPFDLADGSDASLAAYFRMARGADGVPALELTKWFDTNYHYLVPELAPAQRLAYTSRHSVAQLDEARALGIAARPVVLGPVTFLRLAKRTDRGPTVKLLGELLPAYEAWLADLVAHGATSIQIDEPALVQDLDDAHRSAYEIAYTRLRAAAGDAELVLTTYFGALGPNLDLALSLPVDGLHVDLVRAPDQLADVVAAAPADLLLSLGVVDGRNVWKADLSTLAARLAPVLEQRGARHVQLAPSCSLLHLPVDVGSETGGDEELQSWMSFATQRLEEVSLLAHALGGDEVALHALAANTAVLEARATSPRVLRPDVRERLTAVTADQARRSSPYAERARAQRAKLGLPELPTTTIGSFPQTAEVRRLRQRYRAGELSATEYQQGLEAETEACIRRQEKLGLDVLVHGEFERTDMVEFFGERLDGFGTTSHGWVQSYGSRCVKPPVLYGDVARSGPMTLDWARFASNLTDRPVKGMLTGPVTILQWSFVRDDIPERDAARQVALALHDEVLDLEAAGIGIIQIDEPALREGLPLRRADWDAYLDWATEAFRLVAAGVRDETQIHTHMCYAEFGAIMDAIVALDADVISMEASRSGMELIEELRAASYPNEVGPGVWDIHSPRVPSGDEIDELLGLALAALGPERLWVNPDCGLKTRGWPEVEASLGEMVAAAARARRRTG
jgi:5-methyltetrahydropteroyltriglutamate--homocysteine methyltransferase